MCIACSPHVRRSQPQQLSTYALTLFNHETEIDGKKVTIDFWDTAGQERFEKIHPSYYHGANACLLVFDTSRKISYQNLGKWYSEMQQYLGASSLSGTDASGSGGAGGAGGGEAAPVGPHIPTIVVGNKVDVDPRVTSKSFGFPAKHGLPPVEFVSASDGTNVVKVFEMAIRAALEHKAKPPEDEFEADVYKLINDDNWEQDKSS